MGGFEQAATHSAIMSAIEQTPNAKRQRAEQDDSANQRSSKQQRLDPAGSESDADQLP